MQSSSEFGKPTKVLIEDRTKISSGSRPIQKKKCKNLVDAYILLMLNHHEGKHCERPFDGQADFG